VRVNLQGLDMTAALNAALGAVVQSVQFETSVSSPAQLYGSGDAVLTGGGGGIDLGAVLKPKVSIFISGRSDPITIAPFGEPATAKWIIPAIAASIFFAGYFIGKRKAR